MMPEKKIRIPRQIRFGPLNQILRIGGLAFFALLCAACNGTNYGVLQPNPEDLCKCLPLEPDVLDFRHTAKHVSIPVIAAQEIGVDTILSWTQDDIVLPKHLEAGGNFRFSTSPPRSCRKPALTAQTAMCTSRFL
jgi:hypothetical protein